MLENMLDYLRFALYALLILLCFLLYDAWMKDHPASPAVIENAAETTQRANGNYVPSVSGDSATTSAASAAKTIEPATIATAVKGDIVTVSTDVLNVSIDTRGGD